MNISVAMASYNGEKYIQKQLQSILDQSTSVNEIVIVDDCSTDRTLDIVNDFQKKYTDIDWTVVKNYENIGYIENFKKALSLTTGDFIFLCDQDDVWHHNKVEKMMDVMQNNSILVLSSSFRLIDGDDHPFEVTPLKGYSNNNLLKKIVPKNSLTKIDFEDILLQNFCQGCAMVIRKEIAQKFIANCVDDIPHDWQINLLAGINEGAYFLNIPYFDYRIHENNTLGLTKQLTLKDQMTLQVRQNVPSDILKNVHYVEKVSSNTELEKFKTFLENNLSYLKDKRFFKLLFQDLTQHHYYKRMKPLEARVYDLLYALNSIS